MKFCTISFVCLLVIHITLPALTKGQVSPSSPSPPLWPNEFSIAFVDQGGIPGMMYYNWDIKAQRVDHAAGATECTRFFNTSDPCSLYFGPKGFNAFFPKNKTCCTGLNIGIVRPDFLKNQAYHGVVACPCDSGLLCDSWGGDAKGEHKYFSVVKNGTPCAFLFKPTSDENFLFDTWSFQVGPQNPKLFSIPTNCENPCP